MLTIIVNCRVVYMRTCTSLSIPASCGKILIRRWSTDVYHLHFQYACRYWVYHVQHSMVQICDEDKVHVFLQKHVLHWLEALSFMNRISEVIGQLGLLQLLVSVGDAPKLSQKGH
jgi:hypothetical protein